MMSNEFGVQSSEKRRMTECRRHWATFYETIRIKFYSELRTKNSELESESRCRISYVRG
jgi:hypothetical protein